MIGGFFSRISWSKHVAGCPRQGCECKIGITIYDGDGGFVCRIDDPKERKFFQNMVMIALRELAAERQRQSVTSAGQVSTSLAETHLPVEDR